MHTDRCGNTCRQKCCAKGSGKEVKTQEFIYRDTTNVEPEMYDCTSNNWSQQNSDEKLKEKFGRCTRKTFDRFTTKDSYTLNITQNTESTVVRSLKPERWGSPLVQEKYREEKACDKRHTYRIIIIIFIYRQGIISRGQAGNKEELLLRTLNFPFYAVNFLRRVISCEFFQVNLFLNIVIYQIVCLIIDGIINSYTYL